MTAADGVHHEHRIQTDERRCERCALRPSPSGGQPREAGRGSDRDTGKQLEREDRRARGARPSPCDRGARQREQRPVVGVAVQPLTGRQRDERIVRKRRERHDIRVAVVDRVDAAVARVRVDVAGEKERRGDRDRQAGA